MRVPGGGWECHHKLLMILRGERPCASRGTARGEKQGGEVNHAPVESHKLTEPLKVGVAGTSGPIRPASKTVWRGNEPMPEASENTNPAKSEVGGAVLGPVARRTPLDSRRTGAHGHSACQRTAEAVMAGRRMPHGVESAPEAVEGISTEPGNLGVASRPKRAKG
jgi:hypothetical protein